jgi:hypothetical protein
MIKRLKVQEQELADEDEGSDYAPKQDSRQLAEIKA